MPHNSLGEVDPDAYNSLLKAIKSGKSTDYDSMILGTGARRQTSPQCGLAFDMEGVDSHGVAVPPPPALASKEQAGEMAENYWMALLRDVNYLDYDTSPLAAAAAADLSSFGDDFKGPRDANGKVTPQTLFRDNGPGISVGPLTSQFMYLNTPFGVEFVERKMWTLKAGSDHMQSFDEWLAVQNGLVPAAKALMCEVASRCLKATWHKKWQVHRRLRPEAMAGLVEVHLNQSPGRYNGALHPSLFSSTVLDPIATYNSGTALLPMAFPEGSPTHPSYTAGHATVAGACVTMLKAIFDTENRPIPHPVVPNADGTALVPFTGPTLTIEGELNKVASNIASGRNIAGVHWRSDSHASLRIGQAVAISILQEQTLIHNEANPFYIFRGFDGERIVVRNGGVFSS